MTLTTKIINSQQEGSHTWTTLCPDGDGWIKYLADLYRSLRTATIEQLSSIEYEGVTFSTELLKKTLADACLPESGTGSLRVERSDFAETISYCILADDHKTRFGYKSLRDRELVQFTGRGIDAIGIEVEADEVLRLVLGETKLSAEVKSPPQVVDTAKDCMRAQHLSHINDHHLTAKKVFDAARRSRDKETQDLLFAAGFFLKENDWAKLHLISFCCLVRPQAVFQETDCGTFKTAPDDFKPSQIRFATFVVPGDVEKLVDEWLEFARAG